MSKAPAEVEPRYAYIWAYEVRPEAIGDFESIYGPDGAWVELFRRHDGYIRTDLHKDLEASGRYLTVDYWRSRAACRDFRKTFEAQIESLDERCESLTLREVSLGEFSPVEGAGKET